MVSATIRARVDLHSSCVTLAERTTRFSRCLLIMSNAYSLPISSTKSTYAVGVLIDKLHNIYVVTQGLYNRRKQHAFWSFHSPIRNRKNNILSERFFQPHCCFFFHVLLLSQSNDFPEKKDVKWIWNLFISSTWVQIVLFRRPRHLRLKIFYLLINSAVFIIFFSLSFPLPICDSSSVLSSKKSRTTLFMANEFGQ